MAQVAIIAGSGSFPLEAATEAKRQGFRVVVIGLKGWVDASFASVADSYEEVAVGQVGKLIGRLKAHGIEQAVLAGKVTKRAVLSQAGFDVEAVKILAQAQDRSVPALLRAIGDRLAREGIQLIDSSAFLKSAVCPAGILTKRKPSRKEQADIALGMHAARAIADCDIGQTVVVKQRVIVAVEALEGTDAAILRAHQLSGSGLVVVKTASANQDRRLDLPVVGPQTIATLKACGVTCLAVEAGVTLLLARQKLLDSANAAGISIVGVSRS